MNYRAVVIHGRALALTSDADRLHALRRIVEHHMPGRWDEVRPPSPRELSTTAVLEVDIETASAKIREGGDMEPIEPGSEQLWCGVVPIVTTFGGPIRDDRVPCDVPVPPSVHRLQAAALGRHAGFCAEFQEKQERR